MLEVSSPGIERPLRRPEHWRRFVGQRARVRAAGLPGHPTVEIVAVPDDEHVVVRLPGGRSQISGGYPFTRKAAAANSAPS